MPKVVPLVAPAKVVLSAELSFFGIENLTASRIAATITNAMMTARKTQLALLAFLAASEPSMNEKV